MTALAPKEVPRGSELRVLGPVAIVSGGAPIALPSLKTRALLALLALHVDSVVSLSLLVQRLWDVRPPATAKAALRNNVWALRKALEPLTDIELLTVDGGYLLRADARVVDAVLFAGRVEQGRVALRAGAAEAAREILVEALGMWRGPALVDLEDAGFAWPEAEELEADRLAAVALRIEADLALGRHREVVPELEFMIEQHPDREVFHRQHIVATTIAGRTSDAARSYVRARAAMMEHHARRPSEELERAHRALLAARGNDTAGPDRVPALSTIAAADPVPSPLAGGDRDGYELRSVVVLCIRLLDRDPEGDPWPSIRDAVERFGGVSGPLEQGVLTAYFGLDTATAEDATSAVRCAMAVREANGLPHVAAAVAVGVVVCSFRQDRRARAPSVRGPVVGSCQEHVATLPSGALLVIGVSRPA